MRVTTMRAADHDRIYALVSHLPHVLSFALVEQIAGYADADKLFGHTGSGFRDSTRIAGSSPEMWRDVCLANRDALLCALDDHLGELEQMRGMTRQATDRTEAHSLRRPRAPNGKEGGMMILANYRLAGRSLDASQAGRQIHFPSQHQRSARLPKGITYVSGFLEGEDASQR